MQVIAYRENGDTSNIERVFLFKDSGATAGTEGDPITGLTFTSSLLNISTIANNEAAPNTDTSATTSSIETVTTLGTYSAPTAGFVRFREVDATDMPGLYELQWENARYAVSNAIWLDISISGVADLAPFHGRIYLNALPDGQSGDAFARLANYRLGELMSAALASQPFATSLLGDLTQDNSADVGTQQFSTAALMRTWDEILTGATHNIATSAGRRLRGIQEFQGYESGAIWIDTINGTAGTVDFENGTVENPVDSIADANTLAASLGIAKFEVLPGSSITLAATQTNQVFEGENWTLALGGQSIIGTTIIGADVSGIASGVGTKQIFFGCLMGATSHVKNTHLLRCGLGGTQTQVEAGDIFYDDCHSAVAGSGSVTHDFGAALAASNLNVRHHSGGWTIANMGAGAGTYNASFEGNGQIIWAASCSATSNASIRGNWKITDNASGAVTETLDDNQTAVDAIPTTAMRGTDNAATSAKQDTMETTLNSILSDQDSMGITKNAAFSNFEFPMVLTSDHYTAATGKTVTGEMSIDGAAFVAVNGTIAEVGSGVYQIDLLAADTNGDVITYKFSATDSDDTIITVTTRI